jgi:uncharacterized protein YceK
MRLPGDWAILVLAPLSLISGCGTLMNVDSAKSDAEGCKPFGGVRFDAGVAALAVPAAFDDDPKSEFHGGGALLAGLYALGDLPLSAVGDVVTLPYTFGSASKAVRVKGTATADNEIEELNRLANHRAAEPKQRANAVLTLFAKHVRVGSRPPDLRLVLRDTSWLREIEVSDFGLDWAGYFPVMPTFEDRVFILHLFPAKPGAQSSSIYLRLSGRTAANTTTEACLAFLRGEGEAGDGTGLMQFALYDDEHGRLKVFGKHGLISEQKMHLDGP